MDGGDQDVASRVMDYRGAGASVQKTDPAQCSYDARVVSDISPSELLNGIGRRWWRLGLHICMCVARWRLYWGPHERIHLIRESRDGPEGCFHLSLMKTR